jgi:hypothetical protein
MNPLPVLTTSIKILSPTVLTMPRWFLQFTYGLADLHWLYTPSKFTKPCARVKKYANHFVQQALKDKEDNGVEAASGRYAFILELYEKLKDPALVCDQLVNVLIARRDTSASLMSWTL